MSKQLTEEQLNRLNKIPLLKMSEGLRSLVIESIFKGGSWEPMTFGEKDLLNRMVKENNFCILTR